MTGITVTPSRLADLPGLYRACFLTGVSPSEATDGRNPDLLGHIYAGPYVVHGAQSSHTASAEWCRTVIGPGGVAGYLLATPDTSAFESWASREWWPALQRQYPLETQNPVQTQNPGHTHTPQAAESADRELIGVLHDPPCSPAELLSRFPAHLHIDLLAPARGVGLGGRLIRELITGLRAAGVRGVHLGVGAENENAIGFYGHLGFTEELRTPEVVWMARAT